MSEDEAMVDKIVNRWETLTNKGLKVNPESLCRQYPLLLEAVKERILAIQATDWMAESEPSIVMDAQALKLQDAGDLDEQSVSFVRKKPSSMNLKKDKNTQDAEPPLQVETPPSTEKPAHSAVRKKSTIAAEKGLEADTKEMPVSSDADLPYSTDSRFRSFLDGVLNSGLVAPREVHIITDSLLATQPDADACALADAMVRQDKLTRWQADQLLNGRKEFFVGKYKLIDKLGQGGMGTVFKAEQINLGRIVAIKMMDEHLLSRADSVERFRREIQTAASLRHPNIINVYDADQDGDEFFLVMEFVEGRDLDKCVRENGIFPIHIACECVRQAALGLQHAFEKGLVHRDIKPANLIITTNAKGQAVLRILDFGLAKFTDQTTNEAITSSNKVMGTPDYLSPESVSDPKSADIRADIYSLGCTLFRLLTGNPPFSGMNVVQKLMARTKQEAPSPSAYRPEVHYRLDAVVAKMLAIRPGDRYQKPIDVAAALAPFCVDNPQDLDDNEQSMEISLTNLSSLLSGDFTGLERPSSIEQLVDKGASLPKASSPDSVGTASRIEQVAGQLGKQAVFPDGMNLLMSRVNQIAAQLEVIVSSQQQIRAELTSIRTTVNALCMHSVAQDDDSDSKSFQPFESAERPAPSLPGVRGERTASKKGSTPPSPLSSEELNRLSSFDDILKDGMRRADKGDLEGAVLRFSQAISFQPNNAFPYQRRASIYRKMGRFSEALNDCNVVLWLLPENAEAYFARGLVYHGRMNSLAMVDYNMAIRLSPDLARARINRATILVKNGTDAMAVEDCNRAIDTDPNLQQAYFIRGVALANLGDFDAAISDFTRALKSNPKDVQALLARSAVQRAKGFAGAANIDLSEAIRIQPDVLIACNLQENGFRLEVIPPENARVANAPNDLNQPAEMIEQQAVPMELDENSSTEEQSS